MLVYTCRIETCWIYPYSSSVETRRTSVINVWAQKRNLNACRRSTAYDLWRAIQPTWRPVFSHETAVRAALLLSVRIQRECFRNSSSLLEFDTMLQTQTSYVHAYFIVQYGGYTISMSLLCGVSVFTQLERHCCCQYSSSESAAEIRVRFSQIGHHVTNFVFPICHS